MQLRAARLTCISNAVRRAVAPPAFTPLKLFAANEQGIWLDPSDPSTMFQDAAGTTPVTAVEQPVGLILDKSRGLVLGPELVTNGDFSSGTTGWALGSDWVISGGFASRGNNASASNLSGGLGVEIGKTYQVTWTQSSNTVAIYLGSISGPLVSNTSAAGTYTRTVLATASGGVVFRANSTVDTIDNISVRELPGNHATQATATSRPILRQDAGGRYYLFFDGIDDSLVTPIITPGTDKVQVFAGVRKLSDAAGGRVFTNETSFAGTDVGQTVLFAPNTNAANYGFRSGVTTMNTLTTSASYAAPHTAVLSMHADVASDSLVGRVNGVSFSGTSEMGIGDLPARALSIGRGQVFGALQPFNGHLYSLIVRFGPNLSIETIQQAETFFNQKTGAF